MIYAKTAGALLAAMALAFPVAAANPLPPAGGFWPQWRGPDRTNVSTETGLLKEWPAGGPPLAWKVEGLGAGVPSVAVAGGKVFVLGERNGQEFLTALSEADGRRLWSVAVGLPPGEMPLMRWLSQRTPTVDGDRVYTVTAHGELTCLATADGKRLWQKDYDRDFGGQRGSWGYCDFPLVDGDRLVCTPAAPTATIAALDKRTGALVWKCAVPAAPRSTYGGIVAAEIGGVRQYVHQFDSHIVGAAAADGKLLWQYPPDGPPAGPGGNVHTAIVGGDEVFASSGWDGTVALLKLTPAEAKFNAEAVYRDRLPFDAYLGSSVRLGEYVHAANGFCAAWKTGRLAHQTAPPPPAAGTGKAPGRAFGRAPGVNRTVRMSMTAADGRLYHRTGNNLITLSEVAADGKYIKRGEFTAPQAAGEPTWTFPVIAGGRLYLRDQDVLLCYDVREKAARRRPDVIFVPTPQDVVEKMLELAGVTKDDVVADLGCGDGRIVVTAAKKYGCKAVGYDLDKECVRAARENVARAAVGALVRIEHADLFTADLRDVTVATLYLGPTMNARLVPQLETMRPGSRVVSHAFPTPGLVPDKVVRVTSAEDDVTRTLYLWTVPLKKQPASDRLPGR